MDVPRVNRLEYQVIGLLDGFLSLMNENGDTRDDLKVPDNELGKEIETKVEAGDDILVTVLSCLEHEHVIGLKMMNIK